MLGINKIECGLIPTKVRFEEFFRRSANMQPNVIQNLRCEHLALGHGNALDKASTRWFCTLLGMFVYAIRRLKLLKKHDTLRGWIFNNFEGCKLALDLELGLQPVDRALWAVWYDKGELSARRLFDALDWVHADELFESTFVHSYSDRISFQHFTGSSDSEDGQDNDDSSKGGSDAEVEEEANSQNGVINEVDVSGENETKSWSEQECGTGGEVLGHEESFESE
jgi:hypothetical protein